MNFRKYLKNARPFEIGLIPFVNVLCLILAFVLASSALTQAFAVNVRLPKAVTSDIAHNSDMVVLITGENIIYLNDAVVTLAELKAFMGREENRNRPVLIKADRKASVGRLTDVWDLGRGLGIERINIATE